MRPLLVPRLSLEPGLLRSWRLGDASALVAAWTDPEIARWNDVPSDPSLTVARRWISGEQQRLERRLSVDLALDCPDIGGVVGEVGLSGFGVNHHGALIGYWLLPQARGQGLASKAVRAVTTWARQELGLDVVVARCHIDNVASQAVARRAGLAYHADDGPSTQLWRSVEPAINGALEAPETQVG